MSAEVLIVGGGIGGLTAAVALRRAGCDVRVLERAEQVSAVGAGIVVQANAIIALEEVGVADDVLAAGVELHSARISSRSGKLYGDIGFSDIPMLGVGIHRADLQRILLSIGQLSYPIALASSIIVCPAIPQERIASSRCN